MFPFSPFATSFWLLNEPCYCLSFGTWQHDGWISVQSKRAILNSFSFIWWGLHVLILIVIIYRTQIYQPPLLINSRFIYLKIFSFHSQIEWNEKDENETQINFSFAGILFWYSLWMPYFLVFHFSFHSETRMTSFSQFDEKQIFV